MSTTRTFIKDYLKDVLIFFFPFTFVVEKELRNEGDYGLFLVVLLTYLYTTHPKRFVGNFDTSRVGCVSS